MQLRPGAEARIDEPELRQAVHVPLVDFRPLALIKRGLVPVKPQKAQILDALIGQAPGAAGNVQILDAQEEPAALAARGKIRQQTAQEIAQMKPAAGRGREAPGDRGGSGLRAHASISGLRIPLDFFSPSGMSSSISSFSKSTDSVKCSRA